MTRQKVFVLQFAAINVLFLLLFLLAGCGGEKGRGIRQNEYGVDWPLTVSEGRLSCVWHSERRQIVTFITPDGAEYALNGNARSSGFFRSVEPIRQPELNSPQLFKDLNPMIENGLKLCP